MPSVAEPSTVIAVAVLPRPAATWRAARDSVGSARAFLARSVSVAITGRVGLPDVVADLLDESLPMVAAIAMPTIPLKVEPNWAAAVHVRDPGQLAIRLTGRHRWTKTQSGHVVRLVPPAVQNATPSTPTTVEAPGERLSLATIGNYLIAANSDAAVDELGPYLATNLARSKPPAADVHVELRDGALAQWLSLATPSMAAQFDQAKLPWQLQAVVSKQDLVRFGSDVLPQIGVGTLDLRFLEKWVTVDGEFFPRSDANALAWSKVAAVDATRIGALPSDVMVAMTLRRDAPSPPALPADLPEGAKEALAQTAAKLDATAQGEFLLGARCSGVGVTGFLRTAPSDPASINDAIKALEAAASDKRLTGPLKKKKWGLSAQQTRIERVDSKVLRIRFAPLDVAAPSTHQAKLLARQNAIDVLLAPTLPVLYVAAGRETVKTVQELVNPPKTDRLADRPGHETLLKGFDREVWAAVYADPQAVNGCAKGAPGGGVTAPIVATIAPEKSAGKTVAGLSFRFSRALLRLVGR